MIRRTLMSFTAFAAAAAASSGAVLAQDSATRPAGRVSRPEVWLCHRNPLALLDAPGQWAFVRRHVSGIKLYIGTLQKAPADKLAALAKLLKREGMQVAVECGGTLGFAPLDDTNGEASAWIELRKIDRFVQAGGKVDFLDLDGPVRRLLHPKNKKGFDSIDRCAGELMDYLRAVRKVHPRIRFWLLTNFPNWGYRGDVSYHARGPKRQDWGDYHEVVTTVLAHARKAGLSFAGVTVDNPYEYAVGEHVSVKLKDPKKVNWIRRIRAYEDFARSRNLEFNLIANSEHGGKTSDAAFQERTLKMIDAYAAAGGRPTRYVVQSWYDYPKKLTPESAGHSMTALVRAAILKLHPGLSPKPPPDTQRAEALYARGLASQRAGKMDEALQLYYQAIRADGDHAPVLNHLAWLRATNPDPKLRNGPEAVRLAERACRAAVDPDRPTIFAANCLDTLAAACAEAGRFQDAVAAARRAADTARRAGRRRAARDFEDRAELYRQKRPYREP